MVTGSDLKESEHAIEIAKAHREWTRWTLRKSSHIALVSTLVNVN